MGNTTVYGDLSRGTAAWVSRESLRHAQPRIILGKIAAQPEKPLDKNKSDTVVFRRPVPFAVNTIPLAEGVTPTPEKMTYERITVQVKQYGAWSELSDWILMTSEDPVLKDNTELMGEKAAATSEQIIYQAVRGGTNVIYANGASRSAVNTKYDLNKQRAATNQLSRQRAERITRVLDSTPDQGTESVSAGYVAVAHVDLDSTIRDMPKFIDVKDYGSKQMISEHEIGSVELVRYVLSPDLGSFPNAGGAKDNGTYTVVSTGGVSADVYPVLIFGRDAFGIVPLKGANSFTPIVLNPRPQGGDPLGQRGSVGYKFAYAAVILNELWMIRVEVAVPTF